MRLLHLFLLLFCVQYLPAQNFYSKASSAFSEGKLDSARLYIDLELSKKPTAKDFFLSALVHSAQGKDLRALADLEAVAKRDQYNIEAYFQKGLLYYKTSSFREAVKDFTFVLENHRSAESKAVYYAQDPYGTKGTGITTLNSMLSTVYQYRAAAYQRLGEWDKALKDFDEALRLGESPDCLINRSQLFVQMGRENEAIYDLRSAINLDSANYSAWYNLAILDEKTILPTSLLEDDTFAPMLNLVGANAYENGEYELANQYYSKAIIINPNDDLALIGKGKALLSLGKTKESREIFIQVLKLDPKRIEAMYLIGNTLFQEDKYLEAVSFYQQYLSIDQSSSKIWYNTAMSFFNLKQKNEGCACLQKAYDLGMDQAKDLQMSYCYDN